MNAARQLWLPKLPDSPEEHGETLHPSCAEGFVSLAQIKRGQSFKHLAHIAPKDLGYFLRHEVKDLENVYLSQNRFKYKRRRVAALHELDALFADCDFYKIADFESASPEFVFDQIRETLLRARIPEPSLAISSGRGLQLVWLHTAEASKSVAMWNSLQGRIYEVLKPYGADAAARHAATVLRLIGSTHGKTGRRVECFSGSGIVWPFADLAEEIPIVQEPRHTSKTSSIYPKFAKTGKRTGAFAWNGASLWAYRFSELQTIREHRWPEGIPAGWRDRFLFLAAVAFAWIGHPTDIEKEVTELARQCVGKWKGQDTKRALSAPLARAIKAAQGERILWRGIEVDPRYQMKSSTLVDWLDLGEDEMRSYGLRTIVSPDYRKELEALDYRRARGSIQGDTCATDYKPRDRYEGEGAEATRPWEALGISRRTFYRRQAAEAYAALGEDVTDRVSADAVGL